MSVRDRVRRYRQTGGAADLVRVEVLVPLSMRDDIVAAAAHMRAEHRAKKQRVQALCSEAMDRYAIRLFDNVDLSRVPDVSRQAPVIAGALMERGDARAFAMGRRILAALEA